MATLISLTEEPRTFQLSRCGFAAVSTVCDLSSCLSRFLFPFFPTLSRFFRVTGVKRAAQPSECGSFFRTSAWRVSDHGMQEFYLFRLSISLWISLFCILFGWWLSFLFHSIGGLVYWGRFQVPNCLGTCSFPVTQEICIFYMECAACCQEVWNWDSRICLACLFSCTRRIFHCWLSSPSRLKWMFVA